MSLQSAADEIVDLLRETASRPACSCYERSCLDFVDLTELARQRMDWEKAIRICEEAARPCPVSNTAFYCQSLANMLLAVIHHTLGDLETAEEGYRLTATFLGGLKQKDTKPVEGIAYYALGLVWQGLDDLQQAQRAYQQCLRVDSHFSRLEARARARIDHVRVMQFQKEQANTHRESVPVIGTTSAGEPIHAIEIIQGAFLDRLILNGRNCMVKCLIGAGRGASTEFRATPGDFALAVQGNSMTEAQIENGDYVIFRHQKDADNGDIVVVRIDSPEGSKSTVKQLRREPKTLVLKARNPDFNPQAMIFSKADPTVEILGKAVAVASVVR